MVTERPDPRSRSALLARFPFAAPPEWFEVAGSAGLRLDLELAVVARVLFTTLTDTLRLDVRPASVLASADRDTINALGDTVMVTASAFTADGAKVYVAAFGSSKIGVFQTATLA